MTQRDEVFRGGEQPVDIAALEKQLSALWARDPEGKAAATRAANWTIVTYTSGQNAAQEIAQLEMLGELSARIPHRSIVLRTGGDSAESVSAFISAQCRVADDRERFCSEEIVLTADDRQRSLLAPIVSALLLPDLPVALLWLADLLPTEDPLAHQLLESADRIVVDSMTFDSVADLESFSRFCIVTRTQPADLSWIRLTGWRRAIAGAFDAIPEAELSSARTITVEYSSGDFYGHSVGASYLGEWFRLLSNSECVIVPETRQGGKAGDVVAVTIELANRKVTLRQDFATGAITLDLEGRTSITPVQPNDTALLVAQELRRVESEVLFPQVLEQVFSSALASVK